MPTVSVDICPEILTWVLNQTKEEKIGSKLMNSISQWLNGTKKPTFNQIEDLSKKSNIPLGYFFLQTPPVEQLELLEYRTVDSIELRNPSRELIDTIHEMENVQDWMRNYREELGYDMLSLVGSMKGVADVGIVAERIRNDLELSVNWYEKQNDKRIAFNYIRGLLEECGILVMMNGVAGKNTHRALAADEFRAFAMVDEWAPLIFINTADSQGAKLFSLVHEAAHIWLGENDLYNDSLNRAGGIRMTEVVCNAVAGELLVPRQAFLDKWSEKIETAEVTVDTVAVVAELANFFRCGESVIARKALDNGKIGKDTYDRIMQAAIVHYNEAKKNRKSTGGNYYNTLESRLDGCFVRAICESISMGRTSYAEAYRLTNTSRKTFSNIVQKFGGVEW